MKTEWCPFAIRVDGPEWKGGYSYQGEQSPKIGIVPHSAEGYLPGLLSALHGPKTKSWQFTITYNELLQHYPVTTNCWHAGDVDDDGGVAANIDLVGIEMLGMKGDPLTEFQNNMLARVYDWLDDEHQFGPYVLRETVWEHKWVSDTGTECPSYRIRHGTIMALLEKEDHMPTPEYDELKKYIDSIANVVAGAVATITVDVQDLESGATKVPIWPVGEVDLTTIRHRGYHSLQAKAVVVSLKSITEALVSAKDALANHVNMHNSSGGPMDFSSGGFIDTLSESLTEIEKEVNRLGKN